MFEKKRVPAQLIIADVHATVKNMELVKNRLAGSSIDGASFKNSGTSWKPPDGNWMKLNVDGAYSEFTDKIAC